MITEVAIVDFTPGFEQILVDSFVGLDDQKCAAIDLNTVRWRLGQGNLGDHITHMSDTYAFDWLFHTLVEYPELMGANIWCRGTDFDLPIIKHYFAHTLQKSWPFKYSAGRDIRTLNTLLNVDEALVHAHQYKLLERMLKNADEWKDINRQIHMKRLIDDPNYKPHSALWDALNNAATVLAAKEMYGR